VTALRLMSQVEGRQDHDDPPEARATNAGDRTHAAEDVVIVVRDAKGALAAVDVTSADGKRILKAKTDSQGELVVKIEDCVGKDSEVSGRPVSVGDIGPSSFQVGQRDRRAGGRCAGATRPGTRIQQRRIGCRTAQGLKMKAQKGADDQGSTASGTLPTSSRPPSRAAARAGAGITVERIVFRSEAGRRSASRSSIPTVGGLRLSIEDGDAKLLPGHPRRAAAEKDPDVIGSWSVAHRATERSPDLRPRVCRTSTTERRRGELAGDDGGGLARPRQRIVQGKTKTAAGGCHRLRIRTS